MVLKCEWFERMEMKSGAKGFFIRPSCAQGYVYMFSVVLVTLLLLVSSVVIGIAGFILAIFWIILSLLDIILALFKRKK